MAELKRVKCLLAKVSIVRENRDDYDIYNVDELSNVELSTDNYHRCRFISVGNTLKLENEVYRIVKVSCRINPVGETLRQDFDAFTEEPSNSNTTILVFVELV